MREGRRGCFKLGRDEFQWGEKGGVNTGKGSVNIVEGSVNMGEGCVNMGWKGVKDS